MSFPINLSVSGKPSPRTDHPASAGRRRRPMTANRAKNEKSNIFCLGSENFAPQQQSAGRKQQKSGSVITKAELESIRVLTEREALVQEDERSVQVAAFRSPRKIAPKGVPTLSLDDVVGKDDDNTYTKFPTGNPKVHSPTSMDTFSWGTPLKQQQQPKSIKGGGWQVNQSRKQQVAVKSATSSQRKHDDVPYLDLKLSQSNDELEQMRKVAKEVREELNIEYIGTSKATNSNENKCRNKKHEFIEEAILQDQAARLKQAEEKASVEEDSSMVFGQHRPFDARAKKRDELFNTKSMVTGVQDDLSKRFRFSARLLTINGRDAQRELDGFYFMVDNTLTLYEFRQFGTRASVLPFIQRGQYCHLTGHRIKNPYHLLDIQTGKNLTFETRPQSTLPDSLKKSKQTVTFRITGTGDEETRNKLLYHGCKTAKQKEDVKRFVHNYMTQESSTGIVALRQIQGTIRKLMTSRGSKTMTSLFHHFKTLDKSGDGLLNRDEIKTAFQKFRIQVSDQDFNLVWKLIDENDDGSLDYGEFVRGFFGEMNEPRKYWVRKAFHRLDPTTTGVGDAANLYKFFCAAKHPSVVKGEMTESSLMEFFEDVFQITKRKRDIPYTIFEAYYEGISIHIKNDEEFIKLLKVTWTM